MLPTWFGPEVLSRQVSKKNGRVTDKLIYLTLLTFLFCNQVKLLEYKRNRRVSQNKNKIIDHHNRKRLSTDHSKNQLLSWKQLAHAKLETEVQDLKLIKSTLHISGGVRKQSKGKRPKHLLTTEISVI